MFPLYSLKSAAGLHRYSLKSDPGVGLPTHKKPVSGPDFLHLVQIHRLLPLKEPVSGRVSLHVAERRTVNGRWTDAGRTHDGRTTDASRSSASAVTWLPLLPSRADIKGGAAAALHPDQSRETRACLPESSYRAEAQV